MYTELKKPCNHPKHEGPKWLPLTEFHKQGRKQGKQVYRSKCKHCINRDLRANYENGKQSGGWPVEKKKQYVRARSRALTRLSKLVPDLYQTLLRDELTKEALFQERANNVRRS